MEIERETQNRTKYQRRRDNLNGRIEATQNINPITKKNYDESKYLDGWTIDPIQASLKSMEKKNPSLNTYPQSLVRKLSDNAYFLDRAIQNQTVNQPIFKGFLVTNDEKIEDILQDSNYKLYLQDIEMDRDFYLSR